MAKKITANFQLTKSIDKITKFSVFDKIVREIDPKEIPTAYIEQILVQFNDGSIVELENDEITKSISFSKNSNWEQVEDSIRKIKDIKIFINIDKLEKDVNDLVENILGKYF